MPKFLIFLPVRNGGRYVRTAIESVLAQTSDDWRLVILENGSTDGTPDILESYRSDRVLVLPATTDLPIHANWHRALDYLNEIDAQEQLVTFLGHDDLFYPDFLREIALLASANPAAPLYQTLFDLIDEAGEIIRPCRPVMPREEWQDVLAALCWGIRDSFGTGYVFRARDYRAIGGIPDLPQLLYSDYLLVTSATARGVKLCTRSIGVAYRLHRSSTSGAMSVNKFNAEAEALSAFVTSIEAEFPSFLVTDGGRAAFAALLARGTFALRTPAVYKRLADANRRRVDQLYALLARYSRGVPADALVSPPLFNSRFILWLRRANQTVGIWRRLVRTS